MTILERADLIPLVALEQKRRARYKRLLMVCAGTGCVSAKGFAIRDTVEKALVSHGLNDDYLVISTGCNGFCGQGPIMVVQPDEVFYQKLRVEDVEKIVAQHFVGGQPVSSCLYHDPDSNVAIEHMRDIPFFSKQCLIALRNKGLISPERIDGYIGVGGYKALAKALVSMTPEEVLSEVQNSGLRGRGGGGFPTGQKWSSCVSSAKEKGVLPVLVCNADEGDPGAFMDRSIIETDPHTVLEGMCLGAYAIGAQEGFIYIRKEYPLALSRLEKAIDASEEKGLLGKGILGTNFSFDISIHRGAGAFVCGESTALMEAMSGRAGLPRAKYVHNTESGYKGLPTVLNNVETWANIPVIVEKGGDWFAQIGSGDVSKSPWNGSSGTKVFSLVGNVRNTGLVEVPFGIKLREIIFDIGGGIPEGRGFKAVQTGGPSGGCLPASFLDESVDFDTLTRAGSMMGSGGMIVMDDRTCMVDVARYFVNFLRDESCGQCTPCREGTIILSVLLDKIVMGEGTLEDLGQIEEIGEMMKETTLCQLGATACNPVLSTLRHFREEYLEHIDRGHCRGRVCKELITYTITDACTGCLLCKKRCPTQAISGEKEKLHCIDGSKCIKCGVCDDVCKFKAVNIF
jgi:NADH:ubiquinone oxidoreductase subunit F (NADH-binding)/(2Fe-2S) ferredoxin/NAD-dependent dihydropyrimidine dehydrogenase PreA subunit